jgi:hypothetical protein
MSGMWTVRSVTSVGMTVATCGFEPLFPHHVVLDVVLGGPRGAAGAVSALPDPAERRLGLRRRLMLAVAPGAAGALLVVALPARDADHDLYCEAFVRYLLWAQQSGCDRINGAAALKVDVVVWPQARTRLV